MKKLSALLILVFSTGSLVALTNTDILGLTDTQKRDEIRHEATRRDDQRLQQKRDDTKREQVRRDQQRDDQRREQARRDAERRNR